MNLQPGANLTHYRLDEKIGEGGMGVVWKGTDTTLGRSVAIKILPEIFSEDPDRLARFEREAKVLASLNHPNIAVIHGLHHAEGVHFLAMELVGGEDLGRRLEGGPLPVEEALSVARQLAEALEAAHESGVIHRDLKPANIQLAPDGKVKVLDFGLAKAFEPEGGSLGSASMSPTMTAAATRAGMILGTAAYMSPEQARGRAVDRRADIWAFGCVVYEMLTGKAPFTGETITDILAAVVRAEPDWSSLPAATPAKLIALQERCLRKDPRERLRDIGEARIALAEIAAGGPEPEEAATTPPPARSRARERAAWGIVAVLALASGILGISRMMQVSPTAPVVRSSLDAPEGKPFEFARERSGSLSISPDGRYVTFSVRSAQGEDSLWIRALDSLSARPLPGTKRAAFPFWSPDSRYLAFFADGKLLRIDLVGSPPVSLCDAPDGRSGSWNQDGAIIFSPSPNSPIHRVPAAGGPSTPVTRLDEEHGETTHRWATFLPDGRHFLYMAGTHSAGTKSETNAIYLAELGKEGRKLLLRARSNVVYASGYLLYVRDRILLAQPFDVGREELSGDPMPIGEAIDYESGFFRAVFAVSAGGVLVYKAAGPETSSQLAWFGRDGREIGEKIGPAGDYNYLRISPDGKRVAFNLTDPDAGTADVWIQDLVRNVPTRLTFGATNEYAPVWSPDGRSIVYAVSGRYDNLFMKPSGGGEEAAFLSSEQDKEPSDWSADGKTVICDLTDQKRKGRWGVWAFPADGKGEGRPVVDGEFDERHGRLSPDGRWLLYVSDESGRNEVYVTPFAGSGGKWQISSGGGEGGGWSKGGAEVIYVSADGQVLSVAVRASGGGFEADSPKLLFRVPSAVAGDSTPDGQRFLLAIRPEGGSNLPITLVSNWTGDLRR